MADYCRLSSSGGCMKRSSAVRNRRGTMQEVSQSWSDLLEAAGDLPCSELLPGPCCCIYRFPNCVCLVGWYKQWPGCSCYTVLTTVISLEIETNLKMRYICNKVEVAVSYDELGV